MASVVCLRIGVIVSGHVFDRMFCKPSDVPVVPAVVCICNVSADVVTM